MSTERRLLEQYREQLGEDEFNFVIKRGGHDLLRLVNADIAALWPKWMAEAERISEAEGHKAIPAATVAGAALSLGTAALINIGISREKFLQMCADGYDVTIESASDLVIS